MSINFASSEEEIIKYWREINAFQRQLDLSRNRDSYTFYDGPPFATGLPHYGHLLTSTIKDIVPRYWTGKGFYVERRFGWDTHGVPIEYEIDKKFGMSGSDAVKKLGIKKYNEECRSIVMRYANEWRHTIERLGRWIDFDNDYKTMDTNFMESVWWVFKTLWKKNVVYRGYRVMPYSTALNTPLSLMEASQNYRDVQDPAVVVTFPLEDDEDTCLLAWTTTPWTLPSNLSLAVHPDFDYVKVHDNKTGKKYILLQKLINTVYKPSKKANPINQEYKILDNIKGKDMLGWRYKPLYDFFYDTFKDKAFRVITDEYVTADSGVGIVHQAPAFGEDDFRVATKYGIIDENTLPPNPIDEKGILTAELGPFGGIYFKDADKIIVRDLKQRGRLISDSQVFHSYPFCWRSDTPLLYKLVPSWFVRITPIIPDLLANIEKSYWVPGFVKEKRFTSWIKNARDWNISRNRYWGTPIPLWTNDDFTEIVCVESIEELKRLSGYTGEITDIHRDIVDQIKIKSSRTEGLWLKRVDEVFDCWFESGSMPYASVHYPFGSSEDFSKHFPADFIAEGLDQTRGWFYTLSVMATHLFNTTAFKNCVVNGIILAEDGKKMSKRLKNYPDPDKIFKEYGADALRLYLINSPVVRAEPLKFKESGVKEIVSKVLLPLWNSVNFLEQQIALFKKTTDTNFIYQPSVFSNLDEPSSSNSNITQLGKSLESATITKCHRDPVSTSQNPDTNTSTKFSIMDLWILSQCEHFLEFVDEEMKFYRLYTIIPEFLKFLDNLTNWYIRFNRKRSKGSNGPSETKLCLNVLTHVLLKTIGIMSAFIPFLTERIYLKLKPWISTGNPPVQSIHFLPYPHAKSHLVNLPIQRIISRMQSVIDLARVCREKRNIGLKVPLSKIYVIHEDPDVLKDVERMRNEILAELNVRTMQLSTTQDSVWPISYVCTINWQNLGRDFGKSCKLIQSRVSKFTDSEIHQFLLTGTFSLTPEITLTRDHLTANPSLSSTTTPANLEYAANDNLLIVLDVLLDDYLVEEAFVRELINRVQKLRKRVNLAPTDDIHMQLYRQPSDLPVSLDPQNVLNKHSNLVTETLRRNIDYFDELPNPDNTPGREIVREPQLINSLSSILRLAHLD